MQTRSQTKAYRENRDRLIEKYNGIVLEPVIYIEKNKEYDIVIDFDGASKAWLANKQKLHDATYKYICLGKTISGKQCKRKPIVHTDYCCCHK